MDKTITKVDGINAVAVNLRLDVRKCFTQEFKDWMHMMCVCLLAQAFHHNLTPEQFHERVKAIIGKEFGEAGVKFAVAHVTELMNPENHVKLHEEIRKLAEVQNEEND